MKSIKERTEEVIEIARMLQREYGNTITVQERIQFALQIQHNYYAIQANAPFSSKWTQAVRDSEKENG